MKVALYYRRLAKPRGGWRYGLQLEVRVEYTREEWDSLAPYWEAIVNTHGRSITVYDRDRLFDENSNSKTVVSACISTRNALKTKENVVMYWRLQTAFCNSAEDREALIQLGRELAQRAHEAATAFYNENPPSSGDSDTIVETIGDNLIVEKRRIRLPEEDNENDAEQSLER